MRKSKKLLVAGLVILIASAGVLVFGLEYPIVEFIKSTLIAIFTSCLVAIPNLFIAFSGSRRNTREKIDKLIAALISALDVDFPELTYGDCTGEQLIRHKDVVARLTVGLSDILSSEYYNLGEHEVQFLHSAVGFSEAMIALANYGSKEEFEVGVSNVWIAKEALIERIKDVQGCLP